MKVDIKFFPSEKVYVVRKRSLNDDEDPYDVIPGVIRYVHIEKDIRYSIGYGKLFKEEEVFAITDYEKAIQMAKMRNLKLKEV